MTTTLRLLFYSNIRRQTELGYFSWIDEKKQYKGLRAANVVALTETLLVESLYFAPNSERRA